MKKIGFIDYFIDEWHANNYPKMITEAKLGKDFQVSLAWEDTTPAGKKPLAEWCAAFGVKQAKSIEQVVADCDCLVVLSPDNPEHHERLADLPLKSGKPVYMDKPFSLELATARRLVAKAEKHGTPLMSSSALRFATQIQEAVAAHGKHADFALVRGTGAFENYAVHSVEMLVTLMGPQPKRIMCVGGDNKAMVFMVEFTDGRRGFFSMAPGHPFQFSAQYGDESVRGDNMPDFFARFIDGMLEFFASGKSSVAPAETLAVVALLEAGLKSKQKPDAWIPVALA